MGKLMKSKLFWPLVIAGVLVGAYLYNENKKAKGNEQTPVSVGAKETIKTAGENVGEVVGNSGVAGTLKTAGAKVAKITSATAGAVAGKSVVMNAGGGALAPTTNAQPLGVAQTSLTVSKADRFGAVAQPSASSFFISAN